jgi:hypothetical protein
MCFFRQIGAMADGTRSTKVEGVHGKTFDRNFMTMWFTSTTVGRGPRRLEGERTPDGGKRKAEGN